MPSTNEFMPVVSTYHRHLIIEDLLFILPSLHDVFVLLVPIKSSYSPFYATVHDKSTKKLLNIKPGKKTFYQFQVLINWNVHWDDFVMGQLDEGAYNHLIFGHGNKCVTLLFVDHPKKIEVDL